MKEQDLLPLEKKYIEVQYEPVTQGYLRDYCLNNGFDLSLRFDGSQQDPEDFDFHTTVWFTTSEHRLENSQTEIDISVKPKGFALFGELKNVLVLEVQSDELQHIRDDFGDRYNMTDQFLDYRPHITMCYNYSGPLPEVNLPDFDLQANLLKVKKQKEFK